jgi:ATP-dependent RNA helicase DDX47/RRP3
LTRAQYDVEVFQRIEWALGDKQVEYPTEREDVMVFKARVEEAQRHARNEMKNLHADRDSGRKGATLKGRHRSGPSAPGGKGGKRRRDDMDAEEG